MSDLVTKIRNGTRSDADDLCRTCTYCTIVRGGRDSDETRICGQTETRLRSRVSECNKYYNANLTSMRNLYDVAWIISTDKKTKEIGFTPFKKYREREDAKLPDEYFD